MIARSIQALAERNGLSERSEPILVGCFSSSEPLTNQGTYKYQSSGYCSGVCTSRNEGVVGLSNGNTCWCGNELPSNSTQVLDARCNTPCQGYGIEDCGGGNYYFTVWLTGLQNDVPNYNPDATSTASSSRVQVTQTKTAQPEATSTQAPSSSESSSENHGLSDKSIAIIIGVVIGLVAFLVLALIGCCLWRRKKRTGTLRKRPSTLLSFGSRPSSWASIAPDARISILAGSRKWEGRLSATPRRSTQPIVAHGALPSPSQDENPFYTPEERMSSNSSREDRTSGERATNEAAADSVNPEHSRPPMSELTAYPRGSPLPTVLFPGHPNRRDLLLRHQQSQSDYRPPSEEETSDADVVSPLAPTQPYDPTRPPRMVHYPSWSEVSDFDFATNNRQTIERKPVPGWHPWGERRDGRYELA